MRTVLGTAVVVMGALIAWWRWDRVIIRPSWEYKSDPDTYNWRYLVLEIRMSFRERRPNRPRYPR